MGRRQFVFLQLKIVVLLAVSFLFFQNSTPSVDIPSWSKILFERLAGRPPSSAELQTMVNYISTNKVGNATAFAMGTPDFLNITARTFCSEMSTRDESPVEVFNDFTATCMGIFRDGLPATDFLTGNFTYVVDTNKASAQSIPVINASTNNLNQSILDSEGEPYQFTTYHYKVIEGKDYVLDVGDALVKSDRQRMLVTKEGATKDLADPAGLLTTTSFIGSHAYAGTNRRIVEYAFREFLCKPVTEMMDASVSDEFVGRDVTRTPGGDHATFQTNCRACHGQVDALRGAFAHYTWTGLGLTYDTSQPQSKYNQNRYIFPNGRPTVDDSFHNLSTGTSNSVYFGWKGALSGRGAAEFGKMISQSGAFSRCMVKRAFRSICQREPSYDETKNMIANEASQFEVDNYNLKNMFGRVATNSACINPLQAK